MISDKSALEAAEKIVQYCKQQRGCQNCIFRKFGNDHWECEISAFDMRDALSNREAKKKNYGYI